MIIKEIIEDGVNFIKNINAIFDGAEKIADKIKNGNGKIKDNGPIKERNDK